MEDFPELEQDDIRAVLAFAAEREGIPFALLASGAINVVAVDSATQAKMDQVAEVWRKARR